MMTAIIATSLLLIYVGIWFLDKRHRKKRNMVEKSERERVENVTKYLYHRDAKMLAEILVHDYPEIKDIRDRLKHTPYARDGPNTSRNRLLRKLRKLVGPRYRSLKSHLKRAHDVNFYSLVLKYIRKSR